MCSSVNGSRWGAVRLRLFWSAFVLIWFVLGTEATMECWNYEFKIPPALPEKLPLPEELAANWTKFARNQSIAYQEEFTDSIMTEHPEYFDWKEHYHQRKFCIGGQIVKFLTEYPESDPDWDHDEDDLHDYSQENKTIQDERWDNDSERDKKEIKIWDFLKNVGYSRARRSKILGGPADPLSSNPLMSEATMVCNNYEHNYTELINQELEDVKDHGEIVISFPYRLDMANGYFLFYCCNTSLCNTPLNSYCLPGHPNNCTNYSNEAPAIKYYYYILIIMCIIFVFN